MKALFVLGMLMLYYAFFGLLSPPLQLPTHELTVRRTIKAESNVFRLAFNGDSTLLAAATADGKAIAWDVASGKVVFTITQHETGVRTLAFRPDGQTLATGDLAGSIKLWDLATKTLIGSYDDAQHLCAYALGFNPDGKTLACGGGSVDLFDAANLMPLGKFLRGGAVVSLAYAPDGKLVACGTNRRTITLWDASSDKEISTFKGHTGTILCLVFSPDGKTLASGESEPTGKKPVLVSTRDRPIKLWDVATGKNIGNLEGHSGSVGSLAFSPDGKTLASAGGDHTVRLWDVATGKNTVTLGRNEDDDWCVAWSPDGKTLATGSGKKTIKLWDVKLGR